MVHKNLVGHVVGIGILRKCGRPLAGVLREKLALAAKEGSCEGETSVALSSPPLTKEQRGWQDRGLWDAHPRVNGC